MEIEPKNPEMNFYPVSITPTEPFVSSNTSNSVRPDSNIVPSANGSKVINDSIQSGNFIRGSAGWELDSNGNLEASNGTFRGSITGATGTFSGAISATSGSIGGFNIGTDNIEDGANSFGLASTITAGNDVRFWAGDTFANRATAPLRLYEDGAIVATNITATGAINATSGWIGSSTALVTEAQGINVGTTGYVRGGQTSFNTGTGFFLGYESTKYKFSIGDASTKSLYWDGTNLVVNGYVQTNKGAFGGDGSDGALSINSGTTTIDLGNADVVTKNYTSIVISGTGKLAFSNPSTTGTIIILKSQGVVTLTSSTSPCIDASGMGGAGGTGGVGNVVVGGQAGTAGTSGFGWTVTNPGALGNPRGGSAGAGGTATAFTLDYYLGTKSVRIACGAGGGGAGSGGGTVGSNGVYGNTGGDGGAGGGGLIIESGGALNFTGTVSVAGAVGANGQTGNSANYSGGGGGSGGAGGTCVILYNTLTANTGTITVSGGAAGTGGAGNADTGGSSGGSGANQTAGTIGNVAATSAGANGSAGGNGSSLVILNNFFA